LDCGYDEVADGGNILFLLVIERERGKELTRLPLNSTQTAFFLLSVQSWPATVGVMVFGGMCRRPGPSLRGNLGCEGSDAGFRVSPGSTNVSVAIMLC
jgi:hypothetical protein